MGGIWSKRCRILDRILKRTSVLVSVSVSVLLLVSMLLSVSSQGRDRDDIIYTGVRLEGLWVGYASKSVKSDETKVGTGGIEG